MGIVDLKLERKFGKRHRIRPATELPLFNELPTSLNSFRSRPPFSNRPSIMPKIVFYFTQKEAGSDILHPDCFAVPKEGTITIRDVLNAFPLSRFGRYHIRFRCDHEDSYQWIEPQDLDRPCPTYNGGIFLKVLNLEDDDVDKMERNITRYTIEESICTEEEEDLVDDETDLVDWDDDFNMPEKTEESSSSSSSYFNEIPSSTPPSTTDVKDDFSFMDELGGFSSPSPSHISECVNDHPEEMKRVAPLHRVVEEAKVELKYVSKEDVVLDKDASRLTATSYEGKSATVVAAMKAREKELRERQIKALMEKKEREIAGEVKEEEREAAKALHGPTLDRWAYDLSGEKKNIRTLLTTMHTVMWDGAEITPVSMAQVIDSSKVKLYYRKAMLKVHPDKVAGGTSEQIYIAGRIFEALNNAWSNFQDQENQAAQNPLGLNPMMNSSYYSSY